MRQAHVADWLKANPVDVLALQELKLQDEQFPYADFEALGYKAVVNGQKTYNGVGLLSRHPLENVSRDLLDFEDPQKRVIAATVNAPSGQPVRVVSVYVPNGQSVGSEKYQYKLKWLAALKHYLVGELIHHPRLAVGGDFNIAPTDADVHDPVAWADSVLCSPAERQCFSDLLSLGLQDAFCLFPRPEQSYTWWDYRMYAFRRNLGLRIDHILVSPDLARTSRSLAIDTTPRRLERPSDHAPVILDCD